MEFPRIEPYRLPANCVRIDTFDYTPKPGKPHEVLANGKPKTMNVKVTAVFDPSFAPAVVFVPEEMFHELAETQSPLPTSDAPIRCVLLFMPEVRISSRIDAKGIARTNQDVTLRCVGGTFRTGNAAPQGGVTRKAPAGV